MKVKICFLIICVLLVPPSLCASKASAGQVDVITNAIWERKFGDANYSYQNRVVTTSRADNTLFVAGVYSSVARSKSLIDIEGIWIWKINENGEKLSDFKFSSTQLQIDKISDLESMAAIDSGDIVILIRSESNLSYFLKINSKGEKLVSKRLDKNMQISGIIPTSDKSYLLIGSQKTDALLVKIDVNGEVLWKKVTARGKSDMFVDGIAIEDGSYVFVENLGKFEKFFMGSSDLWLLKCDASGQKQSELTFPGRYGSIIRTIDGGYAVLYDKSNTAKQDIWLKTFDKNLNELKDINLISTDWGLEKFKIKRFVNGDFVAGGAANLMPWVSYFDSTGVMKSYFDGKTHEPGVGTDFGLSKSNIYIVSSIVGINAQSQSVNKIKVLKIQP